MQYRVRHTTRQYYDRPVRENVVEVRLRPRSDDGQQCRAFALATMPHAKPAEFTDYLGNHVHTFNVPMRHQELVFVAESVVDILPTVTQAHTPASRSWAAIDTLTAAPHYWEMASPTARTADTPLLGQLAAELGVGRSDDPLADVKTLNRRLHDALAYQSGVTEVDSPIDEALHVRGGVCQDFSHIMLALLRNYLRMPCRYVSGYLFHRDDDKSAEDGSHAWVEAYLPGTGWVGFDPTNNVQTGERHIRVAYGRDYDDVAPARGIFQGQADSQLTVAVSVQKLGEAKPDGEDESWRLAQQPLAPVTEDYEVAGRLLNQLQQQQQQQQ
jgi:transglutaminase-like putative cysteine protease